MPKFQKSSQKLDKYEEWHGIAWCVAWMGNIQSGLWRNVLHGKRLTAAQWG